MSEKPAAPPPPPALPSMPRRITLSHPVSAASKGSVGKDGKTR